MSTLVDFEWLHGIENKGETYKNARLKMPTTVIFVFRFRRALQSIMVGRIEQEKSVIRLDTERK